MARPTLIHIVGPQGIGKAAIASALVAGLRAQRLSVAHLHSEDALHISAADVRTQHAASAFVVVEAHARSVELHGHLAERDLVLTMQRGPQ